MRNGICFLNLTEIRFTTVGTVIDAPISIPKPLDDGTIFSCYNSVLFADNQSGSAEDIQDCDYWISSATPTYLSLRGVHTNKNYKGTIIYPVAK